MVVLIGGEEFWWLSYVEKNGFSFSWLNEEWEVWNRIYCINK